MFTIERTTSEDQAFHQLTEELDKDLNSRYGELQKQYNAFNQIEHNDTVIIAKLANTAIGCGCFKPFDDKTVEIKRVYLQKSFRGNGMATEILKELETWAIELGYAVAVLETGKGQPEAIRFYSKLGYSLIPNYGQYIGKENSVCLQKAL